MTRAIFKILSWIAASGFILLVVIGLMVKSA
jgi:hypothetical protein